ncbi:unnamed protein product [Mytilus edulis]|uniref:Uncharacterized protein n=1 Tax=Mytilus edulis TaxID=6550 RepID=A0A8S3VHR6_MYTED|nr:unnamed protein product [Mytilus edulis]
MVPLFSCKIERIEIWATLAAAEICDDSQIHMLVDAGGVISSILKYLNEATKTSNYYYEGVALLELLSGIDKLACADTNKKKILEAGALPLFEAILNLDKPEEQALTARVLWTMTFDDDVATELKSSSNLLDRLEMLSKSSDKAVKNNVKGLLYNIERISKKEKKDITDKPTQQKGKTLIYKLFWNEKEIVLKLKGLLQEKGIQIWIDTEKMRGSTLEAMAHAVECSTRTYLYVRSYKRSLIVD